MIFILYWIANQPVYWNHKNQSAKCQELFSRLPFTHLNTDILFSILNVITYHQAHKQILTFAYKLIYLCSESHAIYFITLLIVRTMTVDVESSDQQHIFCYRLQLSSSLAKWHLTWKRKCVSEIIQAEIITHIDIHRCLLNVYGDQ